MILLAFLVCGVDKERASANARVEAVGGVAPERKEPDRRIEAAGGETQKRRLPFSSVASRIAAVWCRTHRLQCGRKRKTGKPERDEKC